MNQFRRVCGGNDDDDGGGGGGGGGGNCTTCRRSVRFVGESRNLWLPLSEDEDDVNDFPTRLPLLS